MRALLPVLAIACVVATDTEGTSPTDVTDPTPTGVTDTSTDTGTTPIDPACLVTLDYTATIQTISGTPFGYDDTARLEPVYGLWTYDRCIRDTDPFDSKTSGEYDHLDRQSGAFEFHLDLAPGLVVTGSTRPVVRIVGLDYFYFDDGGEDFVDGETVERFMLANDVASVDIETGLAIGSGAVDFETDELPAVFPMTGKTSDAFRCVQASEFCVTFSVRDGSGTFLMSLDSLTQRE